MTCIKSDTTTISDILTSVTDQWLTDKGISISEFAVLLADKLEAAGLISTDYDPNDGPGYDRWRKNFYKRVSRMMGLSSEHTPIPLEYLLHWVAVLPENYRYRCQHLIAASLGTLFTPIDCAFVGASEPLHASVKANLAHLSKEFADVLQYGQPAMNGVYDHNDKPEELQRMQDELMELLSATAAEMGRIHKATGIRPMAYQLLDNSPLFKG